MNKILKHALLVIGMIGFLSSCQYKFDIEPIIPPPDPGDKISFAEDVLPIWNTNDKCTSCHKAGATSPDLTPENAYNEVMGDYVDTEMPASSIIYIFPYPDNETHNWGTSYTTGEAAVVLQWIEQGALNN
ncbi:MAG: hypothetical protein KAH25_06725 [Bacteroidales bacterium]|nr:hypothetical protein [Bacteroidales bacterium]